MKLAKYGTGKMLIRAKDIFTSEEYETIGFNYTHYEQPQSHVKEYQVLHTLTPVANNNGGIYSQLQQ